MTHPPAPPPAPGRRRRNPKSTRDQLVRAALDLFTSRGYHDTTTPDIARRAGVAEGTIYRHFQSKEHLLNEIYRAGVRHFARMVRETEPEAPVRDRLIALAAAWRDLAVRDPALVQLVTTRRFDPLLDDKSRQARGELKTELARVIASGKAAGLVRTGSADLWADVWFWTMTLVLDRVARREWRPEDAGAQLIVQAAWDAIRMPPGTGQPAGGS